jgi:hypothetical protein
MSDRNRASGISLAAALRALPQTAPENSVWPQLAAQLAAQARRESRSIPRRPWRYALPAALAAAVVLAFAVMRSPAPAHDPATVAATVIPAPASSITTTASAANDSNDSNATNVQIPKEAAERRLASLQKHSQALEHWLRETRAAAAPMPGQDLAAVAEIEDMIGLVDVELSAPARAADLPLWQRRVALLEDLTALRYSNYSVAETDTKAATINRATWIN